MVGGLSELPTFTDFSKTTINAKNTPLCYLRVFQSQKNIYKPLFGLSQVKLLIYPKSCIAPTSYTRITLYIKEEESVERDPCLCRRLGRGFFWFFETRIQRSYLRA